jgi:hypothetical protein
VTVSQRHDTGSHRLCHTGCFLFSLLVILDLSFHNFSFKSFSKLLSEIPFDTLHVPSTDNLQYKNVPEHASLGV